jgi:tetratricopeptide (TPR) repeat protein
MCMRLLDNMRFRRCPIGVDAQEIVVFAAILAIAIGSVSCRKAATASSEPAPIRPASEAITQADQFYAGRADLVKVRQAVVALRQAQADHPSDYDIAWRLAKYNYYLGAHSPEPREQEKAFRDGIEAGKQAVQLQGSKPDGHFWLGANYGGAAQSSMLAGLAGIDDIKSEMETVLKLDQGYESASAYMVLGQVYLQAPKLLGGDVQKSIDYLEKGVKLGPGNALMKVTLAKAYAEAHRNADAQKQIEALMDMKVPADHEPEYEEAVAEAKKVQEKLK